jgi:N-sulfoglucosamine sulfohydrolase
MHWAVIVSSLLLSFFVSCQTRETGINKPNILLILTEDQGTHMGAYGTKGLQTPNMDWIAEQGVLFTSAFVAYPVCSASKAALYTGLYPHSNGCRRVSINLPPLCAQTGEQTDPTYLPGSLIHESIPTLIERLDDAGYYQGLCMKLHVVPVHKFPYDEFLPNSQTFGPHRAPSQEALENFMRTSHEKDMPWFFCYTISMPHRPFRNSDEVPITVFPSEVEVPPYLPNTPVVQKDWAEYLDCIEGADNWVGDALAAVENTGGMDNTIVLLLGDHGPAFQRGKMTLYDLGLRVPLAIMGPGIRAGEVCDEPVSEIDLMPTILDYLGIKRPAVEHGRSLMPILRGDEGASGHDYIFAEIHHLAVETEGCMQERSVYDGRYHLIYRENLDRGRAVNADIWQWNTWLNRTWDETIAQKDRFPELYEMICQQDPLRLGGRPPQFELYDTRMDPHEMNDLAGSAEHQAEFDRLREALRDWAEETEDNYITLEKI